MAKTKKPKVVSQKVLSRDIESLRHAIHETTDVISTFRDARRGLDQENRFLVERGRELLYIISKLILTFKKNGEHSELWEQVDETLNRYRKII